MSRWGRTGYTRTAAAIAATGSQAGREVRSINERT
jgi:hypothetical protein